MKLHKHSEMVNGWLVGNFKPSILSNTEVEVAIKYYQAGDTEAAHIHRIATEITAIAQGCVQMNGKKFEKGDIITIEPGEATDFVALTDCITVVIKTPSVPDDKYLVTT